MAEYVRVVEVGPRDGFQNEVALVPTATKVWFIRELLKARVSEIELGAFVRPDRVPQMADTDKLYGLLRSGKLNLGRARAWALVPNENGLDRAITAGARGIALFTAATDSFTKHNIGMTVRESIRVYRRVATRAKDHKIAVRGYVSTAFGCPFEGKVAPSKTLRSIEGLLELGVCEVSVGDTIGVATPKDVEAVLKPALKRFGASKLAGHFHDTRGTALANVTRALDLGLRIFDSSAGGLGGCPFAPGASGNLATEDLLYLLHGMGFKTGIALKHLCRVSRELSRKMRRPITSKVVLSEA